jgi:hypothetical protein
MRKITLIAILVSFFITGNQSTPLASADEKYPAVQIIIDASGSMDGEKLARTKSAIIETIKAVSYTHLRAHET